MATSNKGRVYVPPGSLVKKRMQQPREKKVPLQGKNIMRSSRQFHQLASTISRDIGHTSD